MLRGWNARLSPAQARYLAVDPRIGWGAAITGAALGVYSHVFLDSVMHVDVRAFAPLSAVNPLQGLISLESLHLACVLAGIAALVVFAISLARRRGAPAGAQELE